MKNKLAVISAIDITLKVLLLAQIKAAQKAGYKVYGVCSKGPNFDFLKEQEIEMFPVKIKRSISPFCDLAALWQIYQFLKREKIDIVHTHTPKVSLIGQLAAKLAGVKVIVNTVHGFYFHDNMKPWKKWFYIAMEWIAGKCSTVILSQNPEDVETAIKYGICPGEKIKCLGNGIDLTKFDPGRFDADFRIKKRSEIGVPADAVVIGIIGRLVKEKGYLELFEAFRDILKKHDHVWLIIIGPEEPEKADRISPNTFKEYGIQDRVCYMGGREDIPELLSCCDIYTLPSWREGFPRSAIEAAAMGLPIVATDIRGCRQVVEHERNGLLVPVKNPQKLAQALLRFIDDREFSKRSGIFSREKALREFDEKNVVNIVLTEYQKALTNIPDREIKH